jgi:peroxiredoxin
MKEKAPDFTLPDSNGAETTLLRFRGEKHVLLVFKRGFV